MFHKKHKDPFADRIPAVTQTQFQALPENWRDYRYGEVIPVFKSGIELYVEVYNSVGCNELPHNLWKQLDAEEIAQKYEAKKVILNGPRHWVINQMEGHGETKKGKVVEFGGIQMIQRAELTSSIFKGTVGDKFYKENIVKRETTYRYWKNNRVYELTAPDGSVYRMQAYAQFIDSSLTIDDLENLGDRLQLPEGWTYQSRVLEKDVAMVADGKAHIINDELGGTYQKVMENE